MKQSWQMSTNMEQDAINVVRPTTKETNAHTKIKVSATEAKVAEIRITEGAGNPRGGTVRASAMIAGRAATNKDTAGRNTQKRS